jgi:hypothetical protein
MEHPMVVPQKRKNKLPYDPAAPPLVYSPSIIHSSQKVWATHMPINGWMDEENVVYV